MCTVFKRRTQTSAWVIQRESSLLNSLQTDHRESSLDCFAVICTSSCQQLPASPPPTSPRCHIIAFQYLSSPWTYHRTPRWLRPGPFAFQAQSSLTTLKKLFSGETSDERLHTKPNPDLPSSSISFVWEGSFLLISSLYCGYDAERRRQGRTFQVFLPPIRPEVPIG